MSPTPLPVSLRRAALAAALTMFSVSFVASAAAAGADSAPRKVASVEGITEYQLANGLRLLLFPDQSQSKVSVNMTVLVGSRHEGYGETGMAHLLEHLIFKDSPRHPDVPKARQEHGAQFNGSTNYDETLAATDKKLAFALGLDRGRPARDQLVAGVAGDFSAKTNRAPLPARAAQAVQRASGPAFQTLRSSNQPSLPATPSSIFDFVAWAMPEDLR